jgi:hypothetical protein
MNEGYQKKRSQDFEHTRAIVYMIAATNRDPKKSFPTIREFWPLPTDSKVDDESEGKRLQAVMDAYKESLKKK